jgi:hypothetical protein
MSGQPPSEDPIWASIQNQSEETQAQLKGSAGSAKDKRDELRKEREEKEKAKRVKMANEVGSDVLRVFHSMRFKETCLF